MRVIGWLFVLLLLGGSAALYLFWLSQGIRLVRQRIFEREGAIFVTRKTAVGRGLLFIILGLVGLASLAIVVATGNLPLTPEQAIGKHRQAGAARPCK